MKIKCIAKIILIFLALFYFAVKIPAQNIKLSEKDKVKIIEVILSENNFEPENYRTDEKKILFSTANIPLSFRAHFPKQMNGYKTYLLSKEEIYAGFVFLYHGFDEFKIKGNSVLITVYHRSKHSDYGVNYRFRKLKGKWKGKVIDIYSTSID